MGLFSIMPLDGSMELLVTSMMIVQWLHDLLIWAAFVLFSPAIVDL